MSPRIRLEPIGEEIETAGEETVLEAAFRHGYGLVHGCREGQCSACKCYLRAGDVALERYSTFALSDSERAAGYALMCRAVPETDVVVELLHYDPDDYHLAFPIVEGSAVVEAVEVLAGDIWRVALRVEEPSEFSFLAGQYVDLHVPGANGARRSFSLANAPTGNGRHPPELELIVKRYPGGRFTGLLGESVRPGTRLGFTGPYGTMHVREGERPMLMVAAGTGMAPMLALLRHLAAQGEARPVRFFYGARAEDDLFYLDKIKALSAGLADFRFSTVLSQRDGRHVQDAVAECLTAGEIADPDVYVCGPPAMVESVQELLTARHGIDEQRIFADKFTASAEATPAAPAVVPAGEGREFEWYRPRGRHATIYEDVTVDTQPSIDRHLTRGWPLHFEDGRGTWDSGSTALHSSDWFEFRDPGEQWERPFYQRGAAAETEIEGAMRSAAEEGLLADFSPAWVEFLRAFLHGPAFVEHGLWFALATAARDCLSDSVATCVALQAAMKQRSAQAVVLYAMDLEEHHGPFAIEAARESWLTDPSWQPARRYVERLAATRDWGEVVVATNLCLEPVLGTLLRRELGTRAAAASGDTVTSVLARVATQEWEWARAWTAELMRFLTEDDVHGARNRARIAAWVAEWMPAALGAATALAPLASRSPLGIPLDGALERVRAYAGQVLAEAGLPELVALASAEPGPTETAAPEGPPRREQAARPRRARGEQAGPTPEATTAGPTNDYVGIVMARSAEGDAVADVMRRREGVEILEQPAFWEVRARDRLVIPYAAVAEQLGYDIDAYSIQHEMTTHYGRLVAGDDALMLFSDPTEAMQYLLS